MRILMCGGHVTYIWYPHLSFICTIMERNPVQKKALKVILRSYLCEYVEQTYCNLYIILKLAFSEVSVLF